MSTSSSGPREICRGVAYPLPAFQELSGLTDKNLREMRAQGFIQRKAGTRSFVLGDDFLDWLLQHGKIVTGDGAKGEGSE